MDKATELAYAEIHSLEMKLLETRDALRGLMRLVEHSHGSSVEEYRAAEKALER
jgi:hypothetical protein